MKSEMKLKCETERKTAPEGSGVDRTLIRQRLALTPAERARLAAEEARKLEAFRKRLAR